MSYDLSMWEDEACTIPWEETDSLSFVNDERIITEFWLRFDGDGDEWITSFTKDPITIYNEAGNPASGLAFGWAIDYYDDGVGDWVRWHGTNNPDGNPTNWYMESANEWTMDDNTDPNLLHCRFNIVEVDGINGQLYSLTLDFENDDGT